MPRSDSPASTSPVTLRTLILLCLIAWCVAAPTVRADDGNIALTLVAEGLTLPLYVTHAGDGSGRLFIVEQGGAIRIVRDGALLPTPFLHLGAVEEGGLGIVSPADVERGLLCLAFHPDYAANGRFFVCFTRVNEQGEDPAYVSEFAVDPKNRDVALPTERVIIGPLAQEDGGHNIDMLLFGPDDGYLYVGIGDGGGQRDPHGHGQNVTTIYGTIARIDVDAVPPGDAAYAIPPDNPFAGNQLGWSEEIWAFGLRNPWRFSFDAETGRLFCGDVGQDTWEEINVITPGGNYGWSRMEGAFCHPGGGIGCITQQFVMPIYTIQQPVAQSITGGFVYRGRAHPGWVGDYIFADFVSGEIWRIRETEADTWEGGPVLQTSHFISSFGQDAVGELYFTSHFEGKVFRIDASVPASHLVVR